MVLMNGTEVARRQFTAIIIALQLGRAIKEEHPEIADFYKKHGSHREIAARLKREGNYISTADTTLEHAVGNALRGTEEYPGLIEPREYGKLVKRNRKRAGRKTGKFATKNGKGAHALSHDELAEYSRQSALTRGDYVWSWADKSLVYVMCHDGSYRCARNPKYPSNLLIAGALNRVKHGGREVITESMVANLRRRMKEEDIPV